MVQYAPVTADRVGVTKHYGKLVAARMELDLSSIAARLWGARLSLGENGAGNDL